MLSIIHTIIARIEAQVPDFKTVGNGSELLTTDDLGKLLPGCFVIPGGGEDYSSKPRQRQMIEAQEWTVVIVVPHEHKKSEHGLTEDVASVLMRNVFNALHGWNDYPNAQPNGFAYSPRPHPVYQRGYAEFPMTFSVNVLQGK